MNESKAYKALLQERADLVSEGKQLFERAEKESRELSDEEKTRDDEINARLATVNAEVQRHEARRERERTVQALPRITDVHDRVEDDPKRGFADVADFALAVKGLYTPGGAQDERLLMGAAPTDFHQENGSSEGRMVPPAFRQEIWEVAMEEDALIAETDNEPTSSNAVEFLKDETTPWGATGIQAKWRSEATKMEPSKLTTEAEQMRLHDLYVFVTATDQLLSDAPRLAARLTNKAGQAIRWKMNKSIVEGTGAGQPKGYMKAGCLVSVAKETDQAADTVVAANVARMYSRIIGASGAVWYINQDVLPQLVTMTLGNQPIWMPPSTGLVNAPGGLLLGRPVRFSEHCETLGDKGDIHLVNLRAGYYAITSEGGVQFASSMHLYFDYGLQAFRWNLPHERPAVPFRCDQPGQGRFYPQPFRHPGCSLRAARLRFKEILMNPNIKPSDQVALLAVLDPVSQAVATVTTDWVSMVDVDAILAIIQTGVLGAAATIDAKLEEATSAAGAGAQDLTGKAITQLVKADNDDNQVMINCRSDELSVNDGYSYVRLSVTVGTAASLISAEILGFYGRYQPIDHIDTVVEVVD